MKQKAWKRRIAILLSFIVCFSLCGGLMPQMVNAAEVVNFTANASSKNLQRGDIVTYSVDMAQNESGVGLDLVFTYDDSVLELQETVEGEVFDGFSDLNDTTSGTIQVVIASNNVLQNGNVFTATFKVKDTAKGSVNAGIERTELVNENYDDLDNSIVNNTSNVKVIIPVEGISLDKNALSLAKGDSAKLTPSVLPEDADAEVSWSSSDTSVAKVDSNGVVTAVGKGSATIAAKADSYTAKCEVTVTVPLDSIEITGTTDTIKKGQTTKLEVVYNPTDTTDSKDVTWSSSDTNVATVSNDGIVTALKDGTVTITATVGDKTDTYVIVVQEIKLTAIDIQDTLTIHKGETSSLNVTYTPTNTTDDTTVTWSSSDEMVASVDANGTITAKSVGGAIITARIGNLSAQCVVTVDAPLKEIIPNSTKLELIKKQTSVITYSFNPGDTTDDKTVTFTSSDTSVVVVDENGTLTAKKAGTATITLKGANNISAVVEVTVKEIPIDEVVLNTESAVVEDGETTTLQATIKPENNTDDDQTISWSSSDETVAIVEVDANDSSKVMVKAISGGTAVITAKAWNGTKATCTIKVPKHIESIALPETTEILRGDTKVLEVIVNPTDAEDDTTVTWTSSNPEIATVDEKTGMITAVKEGTVEITATTKVLNASTNKPFTATATVIVKENHLTSEMSENIVFGEIEALLKGQRFDLNDALNLQDILEQNSITDDIVVEWGSSDDEIATIEQSGIVYGVKEGTVTITATIKTTDGEGNKESYEVTTTLEVKEIPLESIAFDKVISEMQVGAIDKLNVIYNPENTTDDRDVVWTSSDDSILSVENGVVTAKKAGTATITAQVGEQKVSCKITVKDVEVTEPESESSNEGDDSTPKTDDPIKTGDANNIMFYVVLLLCGLEVVILTVKKSYLKR